MLVNSHLSIQQQVRELNQHSHASGNVLEVHRESAFVNSIQGKIPSGVSTYWKQSRPLHVDSKPIADCGKCGNKPHRSDDMCPAKNEQCRICNYYGHFAKKCKTDPKKRKPSSTISRKRKQENYLDRHNTYQPKMARISAVKEEDKQNEMDSFIYAISDNHDEMVWCKVGQVLVEMMIDSGSKFNIIDESTWEYLNKRKAAIKNIKSSNKRLSAYAQQGALEVLCSFEAEIRVVNGVNEKYDATYYVVKGGQQNLLGRDTAKQLGVLLVGLPSVKDEGRMVQHVSDNTIEKFPIIKGVKLRIDIDESVTPVVQHVRRVLIALRKKSKFR
ncbi:uncharacterized protein LOC134227814 [Armigeres subalbatus]|uniref:uncharacterized protein LOC134227814 n=1 Tax=Armigeres subalbatus TaxID=124917 RepID=UPI002ED0CC29